MCRIDKLMWVFCKNRCVKLKKKVAFFLCKIEGEFASTDVVALILGICTIYMST